MKFVCQKSKFYGIGIDFIPSQTIGIRFLNLGFALVWGSEIEIKMNNVGVK